MDQGVTLLDAVQSDNEDEIAYFMNDFDAKFIAPEEIKLTDNQDNTSSLRSEANIRVADKTTTHTKELETNKTRISQKKIL